MKKILAILLVICLLSSCENPNLNSSILDGKKENNIIPTKKINRNLILKDRNYYFEIKVEKEKIFLFLRERIFLDNSDDLESFIKFLKNGMENEKLIIDSFHISISSKIYNEKTLNQILSYYEGSSFSFLIRLDNINDFIPLSMDNIEKIYNHSPKSSFIILANYSNYSDKDKLAELRNKKYKNIKEFEKDYFNNWMSENRLYIWGLKNLQ